MLFFSQIRHKILYYKPNYMKRHSKLKILQTQEILNVLSSSRSRSKPEVIWSGQSRVWRVVIPTLPSVVDPAIVQPSLATPRGQLPQNLRTKFWLYKMLS